MPTDEDITPLSAAITIAPESLCRALQRIIGDVAQGRAMSAESIQLLGDQATRQVTEALFTLSKSPNSM